MGTIPNMIWFLNIEYKKLNHVSEKLNANVKSFCKHEFPCLSLDIHLSSLLTGPLAAFNRWIAGRPTLVYLCVVIFAIEFLFTSPVMSNMSFSSYLGIL